MRNLAERANVVLLAALLTLAFCVTGGLSLSSGLIGFAATVILAAFWPGESARAINSGEAQRKAVEQATAARIWTGVIHALPDPSLLLDSDGNVVMLNSAAREILSGGGIGHHISLMTRAPELLAAVSDALATKNVQSCRLEFKVPVERSLVGSVTPLTNADGEEGLPALLIVLRDLTEQDRLVRMRADFVANASHELRTPLASLKGFVETLQGAARDDPAARDRFLKIMQQQAERMARLIDDLLSLSRIEMKAHVMPRDRVEIGGIIAHVVQMLTHLAREKAITIDVGSLPQVTVLGDRDELMQVFQNLIENAIKYGRNGGLIKISAKTFTDEAAGTGKLAVEVSDDGPGIAPEHLPRLTERFYRVSATQSRNVGGTGLGLAIVKHVLNRHQADLQIESVIGQGSTFRVFIPLKK